MKIEDYLSKSEKYLDMLCYKVDSRRVGSSGNQKVVNLTADIITKYSFN